MFVIRNVNGLYLARKGIRSATPWGLTEDINCARVFNTLNSAKSTVTVETNAIQTLPPNPSGGQVPEPKWEILHANIVPGEVVNV